MILAQKLDKYWVSNMAIDHFPLKRNKKKKKRLHNVVFLCLVHTTVCFFVGNYRNDIRVMH